MEPLPAGARMPPTPPRPPAPPTTGWGHGGRGNVPRPRRAVVERRRGLAGLLAFLREALAELRRTAWPARSTVLRNSAVIGVVVGLVIVVVDALDALGRLVMHALGVG